MGIRESLVKYLTGLILILALLLAISGCNGQTTNSGGKKSIVVTYSVLGSLVKEMVGDLATVTVLIPNGLDPHEWEPSAKDIEKVNNANLVVMV
jgi:zinc/manganese transport system substrate-binding protein